MTLHKQVIVGLWRESRDCRGYIRETHLLEVLKASVISCSGKQINSIEPYVMVAQCVRLCLQLQSGPFPALSGIVIKSYDDFIIWARLA